MYKKYCITSKQDWALPLTVLRGRLLSLRWWILSLLRVPRVLRVLLRRVSRVLRRRLVSCNRTNNIRFLFFCDRLFKMCLGHLRMKDDLHTAQVPRQVITSFLCFSGECVLCESTGTDSKISIQQYRYFCCTINVSCRSSSHKYNVVNDNCVLLKFKKQLTLRLQDNMFYPEAEFLNKLTFPTLIKKN